MKTLRERFEENYVAVNVPADNRKGFKIIYVYYAPWYTWNMPGNELKRFKLRQLLLCAVQCMIFFSSGVCRTSLNTYSLVAVPALIALCAMIFQIVGTVQFYLAEYQTSRMNYTDINIKLRACPVIIAVFLTASVLFGSAFLLKNDVSASGVFTLLGYAVSIFLTILQYKEYSRLELRTIANKNLEEYSANALQKDDITQP